MDEVLALTQRRSEELARALAPAREPRRIDASLAFRDLFMTYVSACVTARGADTEIHLGAAVYDKARSLGLFSVARERHPGIKIWRKSEIHTGLCTHGEKS